MATASSQVSLLPPVAPTAAAMSPSTASPSPWPSAAEARVGRYPARRFPLHWQKHVVATAPAAAAAAAPALQPALATHTSLVCGAIRSVRLSARPSADPLRFSAPPGPALLLPGCHSTDQVHRTIGSWREGPRGPSRQRASNPNAPKAKSLVRAAKSDEEKGGSPGPSQPPITTDSSQTSGSSRISSSNSSSSSKSGSSSTEKPVGPTAETTPVVRLAWYASEAFGKAVAAVRGGGGGGGGKSEMTFEVVLSREEAAALLRKDYDQSYFVTGAMTMDLYNDDCEFADPFVSFRGRQRFKDNVSNLGSFMQDVNLTLLDWQETEDKVTTKWRFSCVLGLPWKPILAASGGTDHFFDRDTGRICKHVERWDISPADGVRQLFKPNPKLFRKRS